MTSDAEGINNEAKQELREAWQREVETKHWRLKKLIATVKIHSSVTGGAAGTESEED